METQILNAEYWNERYTGKKTGWDLGAVSPPLKRIIDKLKDTEQRILIPGGGNGYEAFYLHTLGFTKVYLLDWARIPLENFSLKHPDFPSEHLLHADFFDLEGKFDLILEQTFFCALFPSQREDYARKMATLLDSMGRLTGVLFKVPLYEDRPPFGGSASEYHHLFSEYFQVEYLMDCEDSEKSRRDMEVEFSLRTKKN